MQLQSNRGLSLIVCLCRPLFRADCFVSVVDRFTDGNVWESERAAPRRYP